MPTIHDFMDLTNDSDDDDIVILPKSQLVRTSSLHSTSLHSRPQVAPQPRASSIYSSRAESSGCKNESVDRYIADQLRSGALTQEDITQQKFMFEAYKATKNKRTAPASIARVQPAQHLNQGLHSGALHNQQQQGQSHMPQQRIGVQPMQAQYYAPMATITFTLISLSRFSIIAEVGGRFEFIESVLRELTATPGFEYDDAKCRLTFQLKSYQAVASILTKYGLRVAGIDQSVIATATLRLEKLRNSGGDVERAEERRVTGVLRGWGLSEKLMGALAPFQQKSVEFVCNEEGNNGRALIADDMGLGKTRQAIGCAAVYEDEWPCLIVCPSSARFHWKFELLQLLDHLSPQKVTVVESKTHPLGTTPKQREYQFVIISYNLVSSLEDNLHMMEFGMVICDESHYLKSAKAKRTKSLMRVMKRVRRLLMLSGTPALSRPVELFTVLNILDPRKWNSSKDFIARYCRAKKKKGKKMKPGAEFKGASNTHELHLILTDTLMIRRLKGDILKNLPKKHREIVQVAVMDDDERAKLKEMYEEIRLRESEAAERKKKKLTRGRGRSDPANANKRFRTVNGSGVMVPINANDEAGEDGQGGGDSGDRQQRMSLLMSLFLRTGVAKLPGVLVHLEAFLAEASNGKVLIFAHHVNVLDGLADFCGTNGHSYIRIDGGTYAEERQNLVMRFQKDPSIRVAVLAITAAGVALTLTAAATVYFAEMFWTPGSLLQAEDRAHRIGQLNAVKIKYFLASNTVDELLWPLVREKMKTLGEICEGRIVEAFKATNVTEGGKNWDGAQVRADGPTSSSNSPEGNKNGTELLIEDKLVQDIAQEAFTLDEDKAVPDGEDDEEEEEDEEEGKKDHVASVSGRTGARPDNAAESDDDEEVEPDQLAVLYLNFRAHLDKVKFKYQDKSPYDPNKTQNSIATMQSGFGDEEAGGEGLAGREEGSQSTAVVDLLDSEDEDEDADADADEDADADADKSSEKRRLAEAEEVEEAEAMAYIDDALVGEGDLPDAAQTAARTSNMAGRTDMKLINLLESSDEEEKEKEEKEEEEEEGQLTDQQPALQSLEAVHPQDSTESDALSDSSNTLHMRRIA